MMTNPEPDEADLAPSDELPALPPGDLPPGYRPAAWSWPAYFASNTLPPEAW
ncbi:MULTISPECIES: hypothetical protein [unclassified Streptomyces]|uniref:hypothetical protein n=1 Tax=unclassified Streptomyces TaxID=2593676 RepID=UPI002E187306|nr:MULTISPECIES: hypothetical protein [unclassified Streptomyces]